MLPSMNAYSKDLRLKVLDAVDRGIPRREVSDLLGISLATVSRYIKLKASAKRRKSLWEGSEELGQEHHSRMCHWRRRSEAFHERRGGGGWQGV